MKWGEFKEFLEKNGVKNEHDVDYIDYDSGCSIELRICETSFLVNSLTAKHHSVEKEEP